MFERFTERARQVIVLSQEEARGLKHNYIGTEHFLLGLIREEEGLAARVLRGFDITVEHVRAETARIVGAGEESVPGQIPFTPRVKKVLERALREALSLGHNYIGTEHLLLALVHEHEGLGMRILLARMGDETILKSTEKIRSEVLRQLTDPEREELAGETEESEAVWIVDVTYLDDSGTEVTRRVGGWPQKPEIDLDDYAYRVHSRIASHRNQQPTVVVPIGGVLTIELKKES